MKKLFILIAITLIIGCKKDEDVVYYPSYSINAHIVSSKNGFMLNGFNVAYDTIDFKFLERYTGENATLNLRTNPIKVVDTIFAYTEKLVFDSINARFDTIIIADFKYIYDTTYFKVVYTLKDKSVIVHTDSGYSTGYDLFVTSWQVK